MFMHTALTGLTVAAAIFCLSAAQAGTRPERATVALKQSGSMTLAKNGADNAAGDRGGRGQGRRGEGANHAMIPGGTGIIIAKNGADNAAGHNKGDNHDRV